ncbi:hypothetical protein [Streptomyces mirabilis]
MDVSAYGDVLDEQCKACALSGPESVTRREQVECVSGAIGRKVVLEETMGGLCR